MKKIASMAMLSLVACTVGTEPGEGSAPAENIDKTTQAITYGVADGADHPAVVLLLMEVNGAPAWRCSGTLLNATTVLTAGHCTEEPGVVTHIRAFTESSVLGGNNNYPYAGPNAVEGAQGGIFTHPLYTSAAFSAHDVGIVKLKAPGFVLPANKYGTLPAVNALDALQPRRTTGFTAVGYGLQRINDAAEVNPKQISALKVRMRSNPYLLQINSGFTGPQSLLLSNNAATGGTCFGDSGGPNFLGNSLVVAGVTSFGLNGACGGTGGVFRTDRQDVLDFINAHID
jgi:V8-like Glu-specific endopeptidase